MPSSGILSDHSNTVPTRLSGMLHPHGSVWNIKILKYVKFIGKALQCCGKGKGKIHPTAGHEGLEGEYRYGSTLSLISALDGLGV